MKNYEEVIAEISRIEKDDRTGELYLVFKVKSEAFKKKVLETWTDDIEYRIVGKNLVK